MPDVEEVVRVSEQGMDQLQAKVDRLIASLERLKNLTANTGMGQGGHYSSEELQQYLYPSARREAQAGVAGTGIATLQQEYDAVVQAARTAIVPRSQSRQQLATALSGEGIPEAIEIEQERQQREGMRQARVEQEAHNAEALRQARVQREGQGLARARAQASREDAARDAAPERAALRAASEEDTLQRQIAREIRRGADPLANEALRLRLGNLMGSRSPQDVAFALDYLKQGAVERGMLPSEEQRLQTEGMAQARIQQAASREDAQRDSRIQREGQARARAEQQAYNEQDRIEQSVQKEGQARARAEEQAHREEERRNNAGEVARFSTLAERNQVMRTVARELNRGADPMDDPYIRARLERLAGSDDPQAMRAELASITQQANELRLLQPGGVMGGYLRALSYAGVGAVAVQGATQAIGTVASGEPLRPQENLATPLTVLGGILGTLVNPGVGTMIGAGALGTAGNFMDAFFHGRRQQVEESSSLAAQIGWSVHSASPLALALGSQNGPGGPMGAAFAAQQFGPFAQASYLGTDQNDTAYEQEAFRRQYGLYGKGSADVFRSALPFLANPQFGASVLRSLNGDTSALSSADAVGMSIANGPEAALAFATANRRPDLQEAIRHFNASFQNAQFGVSFAESATGIAGSRFQETAARGLAPTDPRMGQAFQSYIDRLDANVSALRKQEDVLREASAHGDKYAKALLLQTQAQEEAIDATRQQATLARRVALTQYGQLTVQTQAQVAGAAFQAGAFGLAPGTLNPATRQEEQAHRAELANAIERSIHAPTAEMRAQARGEAAALRNVVAIEDPRARMFQQFLSPLQAAQGFGNRFLAGVQQNESFGMNPEDLQGQFGTAIGNEQRTLARAQTYLREIQGAFSRGRATFGEVEGARDTLNQEELTLRALRRESLRYPGEVAVERAGERESEVGARAALSRNLLLGPEADVEQARNVYAAQKSQIDALRSFAQTAQGTREGEQATNRANILGTQQASDFVSALSSYRPEASLALGLSRTQTAEELAQNDIIRGGYVPLGLRRARMGQLSQSLGEIESRIEQTPQGPLRDAVAANLEPQRSSMLLQLQQEQQASQFGEVGHMINVSVGTPGTFWTVGPNLGTFQRLNPGGARAFGGSGESVGMSDLEKAALGGPNLAQTLGGTGGLVDPTHALLGMLAPPSAMGGEAGSPDRTDELLAKLDQMIDAIRSLNGIAGDGKTKFANAFGVRDLDSDPREQVRRASLVNR